MYIGLPLDCLASTIRSPYKLYAEDYSCGCQLVGDYEGGACPRSHSNWNVSSISVEDNKLVVRVDRDFEAPHTDAFLIGDVDQDSSCAAKDGFFSKLLRKKQESF